MRWQASPLDCSVVRLEDGADEGDEALLPGTKPALIPPIYEDSNLWVTF